MSPTTEDLIRASLADRFATNPGDLPTGWRTATEDEKTDLICRAGDIVLVSPFGDFWRLPIWLDWVPPKSGRNVRVLDDPDRESYLSQLGEAMAVDGVTRDV
ncbi:hypothetical protein [Frankia sp. AgW1.1]|uniref:hypothetical protein n=1 Tax=Frankia sp. AgW1.1 TaxID=1836971 RepID=UPI001931FBF8|nr:hypothetical protein [Frankia sp. AgW1.1]MBL7487160.1 hypothetical protein [Frankia sp. AgW1.1]